MESTASSKLGIPKGSPTKVGLPPNYTPHKCSLNPANNLYKNIPIDIVLNILSYDRRFIIRKDKVITINLLDLKKFKNINKMLFNRLLQKKPKSVRIYVNNIDNGIWFAYSIKLTYYLIINYHINFMNKIGDIYFVMTKNINGYHSIEGYNVVQKIKIK